MICAGLKKAFLKNVKVGLENVCEEMVVIVAMAIAFHRWKCLKSDRKTNLSLLEHIYCVDEACSGLPLLWKYLRLQQFLCIPKWNASRTFNSHHHPFQEKSE